MQLIPFISVQKCLSKLTVLERALVCVLTVSFCAFAVADVDASAKRSLSADQHYAAAKKLVAMENEDTAPSVNEEVVYHLEQAISQGYKNPKEARLLLQNRLLILGASAPECDQMFKNSKDPAIQKRCRSVRIAMEKALRMIDELHRDFPDDANVILLYARDRDRRGANSKEVESLLRKAAAIAPNDSNVLAELAGYANIAESKLLYADAVAFSKNDEIITHNIEFSWRNLRNRGCATSPEIDGVVDSLPKRFVGEGLYVDPNDELARRQFADDRKKLLLLRDRFVTLLRAHRCS